MTRDEAAAELNGCEYGAEESNGIWDRMKAAGLVAVYGASDDLMEFSGAMDEEVGAYDGTTALVTPEGLFESCGDDCKYSLAAQKNAVEIDALWCAEEGLSWSYETDIPHSTFEVMEDGAVYCRGIVFALADAIQAAPLEGVEKPQGRSVGDTHTAIMELIREDLERQHPDLFTEDNDGEVVIPSGCTPQSAYVKLDISALAEVALSALTPPQQAGDVSSQTEGRDA